MKFFLSAVQVRPVFAVLLAVFIAGCASVQAPPGGPKDETPPILMRTVPNTGSTNYKAKIIELYFNEPVQLENLYKQMLVTPYIEPKFTPRVKKDRVIIEFENKFADSTTYTINLREGVVDATEKNVAENVKLAFSTGPFIDSLSVKGNVKELFTGMPAEDVTVMLYRPEDTINVQKPYYLTKSDEKGNYELENLQVGSYKLFAVKEEDNDMAFTKEEEMAAFLDRNIQLDSNILFMNLNIAEYDNTPFNIIRAQPSAQYVEISYSKPIEKYKITFLNQEDQDSILHIAVNDYIKLYSLRKSEDKKVEKRQDNRAKKKNKKNFEVVDGQFSIIKDNDVVSETDSITAIIEAFDISENYLRDTVKFVFSNRRKVDLEAFSLAVTPRAGDKLVAGDKFNIDIKLNKPASKYDLGYIQLLKMKDSTFTVFDTLYELVRTDFLPIAVDSSYLTPIDDLERTQITDNQSFTNKLDTLPLYLNDTYKLDPKILGNDISLLIQSKAGVRKKEIEQVSQTPEAVTFAIKLYDLTTYQLDTSYIDRQVVDSLPLPYPIEINDNRSEVTISDFVFDPTERLLIDSLAFVSVESDTSTQQIIEYKMKQADQYGVIGGTVQTTYENFFIQLLNSKYEVEQEFKNERAFRFEFVEPGEKYLRVLVDENNDGEWSKGDVEKRIMPEPVFFQEGGSIEVKPNWEILGEIITTTPSLSTNQQNNTGK